MCISDEHNWFHKEEKMSYLAQKCFLVGLMEGGWDGRLSLSTLCDKHVMLFFQNSM